MAVTLTTLLNAATGTGAGTVQANGQHSKAFQVYGTTTAGSGSATVKVQGSLDGTNWVDLKSFSLTLGTAQTSDFYESIYPWAKVRGNVTAISGTGASVTLLMGK